MYVCLWAWWVKERDEKRREEKKRKEKRREEKKRKEKRRKEKKREEKRKEEKEREILFFFLTCFDVIVCSINVFEFEPTEKVQGRVRDRPIQ